MPPTVLPVGHHGPRTFVRDLTARTAMVLLASLAAPLVAGRSSDGEPPGAGLLARLRRLVRRPGAVQDPPLADRRLAVPPPNLELEVAAARERARAESSAARPDAYRDLDDPDARPIWVRRMDEWSGPPSRRRRDLAIGFDDGWDPPSAGSQPDSR